MVVYLRRLDMPQKRRQVGQSMILSLVLSRDQVQAV